MTRNVRIRQFVLLCVLTILGSSLYVYMLVKHNADAESVDFGRVFPSISVAPDEISEAYSAEGKDRTLWGKLVVPSANWEAFARRNGFNDNLVQTTDLESMKRNVLTLVAFTSRLQDTWMPASFIPEEAIEVKGVRFLIGRNEPAKDTYVIYALSSD